jgi:hypothetical protein
VIPGARGRSYGVALAALLAVATAGPAHAATSRATLIARWSAANHRPPGVLESAQRYAPPPADLPALVRHEIASGRYRLAPAPPAPPVRRPWWLRAWDWLYDRWVQLWQAAFGKARLGRGGAVIIGDLLIAVAAGAVLWAALRLLRELAFERRRRAARYDELVPPPDASALYRLACERAAAAEYATASQLLFAATIAGLARRGTLADDRSATVGDFRRALGRDRRLLGAFDDVATAFVTSTYAELPVEPSSWERARSGYLALDRNGAT